MKMFLHETQSSAGRGAANALATFAWTRSANAQSTRAIAAVESRQCASRFSAFHTVGWRNGYYGRGYYGRAIRLLRPTIRQLLRTAHRTTPRYRVYYASIPAAMATGIAVVTTDPRYVRISVRGGARRSSACFLAVINPRRSVAIETDSEISDAHQRSVADTCQPGSFLAALTQPRQKNVRDAKSNLSRDGSLFCASNWTVCETLLTALASALSPACGQREGEVGDS